MEAFVSVSYSGTVVIDNAHKEEFLRFIERTAIELRAEIKQRIEAFSPSTEA